MNVKQLISKLQAIKPELQEKEVLVIATNGMQYPAEVRFKKKDRYSLDLTEDNVEAIFITD